MPVGELAEDEQQAARLVLVDAADDARLVAALEVLRRPARGPRRRSACALSSASSMSSAAMWHSYISAASRVPTAAHGRFTRLTRRTASAVESVASCSTLPRCSRMNSRHWPYACGMLMTLVIWLERHLCLGDEHLVHRMGDLAHDVQVLEAQGEAVQGDRHRALERVLDGDDAQRHLAALHGAEHVADGGIGEGCRPPAGMLASSASSVNVPSGPRNATLSLSCAKLATLPDSAGPLVPARLSEYAAARPRRGACGPGQGA